MGARPAKPQAQWSAFAEPEPMEGLGSRAYPVGHGNFRNSDQFSMYDIHSRRRRGAHFAEGSEILRYALQIVDQVLYSRP